MRILANTYGYPPRHNAGSENTMHGLLRFLQDAGHEVRVYAAVNATRGVYDGVPVEVDLPYEEVTARFAWADVAMTHLHRTGYAIQHAQAAGVPLVHVVHNPTQLAYHHVTPDSADLVVFNSAWIAEQTRWPGPWCVVNPPIDAARCQVDGPGDCVTLINLDDNKGSRIVWELARRMQKTRFLGVRGSYGHQVMPSADQPNAEVLCNMPDIRDVYRRTKLLLMPSRNESWGRTAMEAAASGIPTIAHPTPGLLECLGGGGGIFLPRDDLDLWQVTIGALLRGKRRYAEASAAARARFEEYSNESPVMLAHFEAMLRDVPSVYARKVRDWAPAPVTFRCERYPALRVRSYGVQFRGGLCTTRDRRAIAMLRRGCHPVEEIKET